MKVLGTKQFMQKRYQLLGVGEAWRGVLGDLPTAFIGIVYGESGNGKTEFCVRIALHLSLFGKVAWLSYEQGHGYDLQRALDRNSAEACQVNPISWIDPMAKSKPDVSKYQQLMEYLARRSTPQFVIIDSVDYLQMSVSEYYALKERFGHKKGIVFISHSERNKPKTPTGVKIEYDGGFGILVKNFLAIPRKNRFGGHKDYVIWEEEARKRNPYHEYFYSEEEMQEKRSSSRKRKRK